MKQYKKNQLAKYHIESEQVHNGAGSTKQGFNIRSYSESKGHKNQKPLIMHKIKKYKAENNELFDQYTKAIYSPGTTF